MKKSLLWKEILINEILACISCLILISIFVPAFFSKIKDAPLSKMLACTVRVRTETGAGSGVVINRHQILTAYHVVKGNQNVVLDITSNGTLITVRGIVCKADEESDLALIEMPRMVTDQAIIGISAAISIKAGDPVYTVGATMGHDPSNCARAYFTGRTAPGGKVGLWQISGGAWFGNSGGGVFESKSGLLIGIVTCGDSPYTCWFVPAPEIESFLER